jgi:hypothetical protein
MTSICVIPMTALMRYVGYMGPKPVDLLTCFWKYHGCWREADELSRQLSTQHHRDIDLLRELTEKSHVRSYWPGDKIFCEVSDDDTFNPQRHRINTSSVCSLERVIIGNTYLLCLWVNVRIRDAFRQYRTTKN